MSAGPAAADPVRGLADALGQAGALKLWSVVVTCLGDVSQARTGPAPAEVSGPALSALVDRIGLQPQAMRVALHRLKRDGWLESRREGRIGHHRLSESALRQTRAVAARVYGPGEAADEGAGADGRGGDWALAGLPPEAAGDTLERLAPGLAAVPLSRGLVVVRGPRALVPGDWLLMEPAVRPLPDWALAALRDAACETSFAALAGQLAAIGPLPRDALDRFVLRVLVLHGWRRLILRSNPAAEAALGPARAETACRAEVQRLLGALDAALPPELQVVPA